MIPTRLGLGLMLGALLALMQVMALSPVMAQTFPALTGRVVDAANILSQDVEASITARSAEVERQTGSQLVVVTVPDLQGYPIEEYGYRLGRTWGIGQKGADNGVILLVAPKERRVRIEVGYGLEPVLTDALSSVIIQQAILPYFRDGQMSEGIEAGFDAIARQFELPPEEAARNIKAAEEQQSSSNGGDLFTTIIIILILLLWIRVIYVNRKHGGKHRKGGHAGPIVVWGPGRGGWGGGGWGGGSGGGFGGGGGGFGGGGASGGW